jgi:quercetin dioxygenase-like cupin family protein
MPEDGDARWFIHNLVVIKLTGKDTGGQFSLDKVVGAKSDMPPLHVHHIDDETFMVLEGEVSLHVGGQSFRGGPGSVLFAPRGVPHAYRLESETARMRVISSPRAFPEFVLEASVPAGALTLPTEPPPHRAGAAGGDRPAGTASRSSGRREPCRPPHQAGPGGATPEPGPAAASSSAPGPARSQVRSSGSTSAENRIGVTTTRSADWPRRPRMPTRAFQ